MSGLSEIDWNAAKKQTLEKLKNSEPLTKSQMLKQYALLLKDLQSLEFREKDANFKCFTLHDKYERLALQYSTLFNLACRREKPYSVETVKLILETACDANDKKITDEQARQKVMSEALSLRNNT